MDELEYWFEYVLLGLSLFFLQHQPYHQEEEHVLFLHMTYCTINSYILSKNQIYHART